MYFGGTVNGLQLLYIIAIVDFIIAKDIAESAGIDIGEAAAIMLARRKKCAVLIDDLAARRFAAGLGLEVVGSIGVLIRCARVKTISKSEALDALDRLGRVMWLTIDVYDDARKIIDGLPLKTGGTSDKRG